MNEYINDIKNSGVFDSLVSIYMEKGNDSSKTGVKYTTAEVQKTEKNLIVVTNCPFEPFEYTKEDGLMYGIDIEIANAFAKQKGLELVVRNIDFDNILKEVSANKADIGMAGITVTEERKKICDFTDTYIKSAQKLVVDGKNTDFDKCGNIEEINSVLKSLTNKSIGFQEGTTGNLYIVGDGSNDFPGFSNIKPIGFNTPDSAIKNLLEGKIYAAILDDEPAKSLVDNINFKFMESSKLDR